ncbi:Leukocyte elastase inhibitor [Araneus ventricosus]|uniref:Leukocyte elastase inhibitor n=1 Tax=Araneus ventricosus TaxID=182803 RepID=A0A4Y2HH75_ARAVE|nr:Leukocyte elastase inhibitor [Araneus ventricosus]
MEMARNTSEYLTYFKMKQNRNVRTKKKNKTLVSIPIESAVIVSCAVVRSFKEICFIQHSFEVFYSRAAFNIAMLSIVLSIGLVLIASGAAFDLEYDESCTADELMEKNVEKLAMANNDLALKLYRKLSTDSPGNLAFSPLSLSIAFGMLFYAARENTANELRQALSYEKAGLSDDLVHQTFHWLLKLLMKTDESSGYVLQSANAILIDEHLQLVPEYKTDIKNLYNASVMAVDFANDAAKIVRDVNEWVSMKTRGNIKSLLNSLSPSSSSIILNALYFKGTWRVQFPINKTSMDLFYNNGLESEAKYVPMMHLTTYFRYMETLSYQVLELPFKQRNVSMFILLPTNRDGLKDLEKSLNNAMLFNIRRQLYAMKVIVSLPRFKVEYSKELSEEMQELGAKSIFQAGFADFSGMTPSRDIYVNQILHKAMMEVNEAGSQAASLTGIATYRMWPILDVTPEFVANRPFLVILMENGRTCFFITRVNSL